MDYEAWENFGGHLCCVANLNYFPEEWEVPYSGEERFFDFVSLYKEDYKLKRLKDYNLLENNLSKYTGFLNLPSGEINLMEDNYYGQFVFLKDGEIRYLQNEEDFGDGLKKEQVFFGKESLLYKEFRDLKEDLYWDNYDNLDDEPDFEVFGDKFYENFKENNLFQPCLTEVHREFRFKSNKKHIVYLRQMNSENVRINLDEIGAGKPSLNLILNSSFSREEAEVLKKIKRNPEILNDLNLILFWIKKFSLGKKNSLNYLEKKESLKNLKTGFMEKLNGF